MALYRFAAFEFDPATGELVRDGRCVRLRPQPARVLEHLLMRPGALVSRDELRRSIWPDGTYVHFDHGLNSCIKQIRAALAHSDPAADYIETLVKRGFRFVVPVERIAPLRGSTATVEESDYFPSFTNAIARSSSSSRPA